MKIRIRKKGIVQNSIIIVVLLYSIMPVISRFISSMLSTYFYMGILLILVVFVVFANKKRSLDRNVWILFPFVVWRFLEFFVTSEPLIIYGYQSLVILMPVILGIYILRYRQYEHRFFCKIICLAFVVTLITTVAGLLQYPEAARWLATVEASNNEKLILYNWKNMGGYEFVYSVILLYPMVIFAYKQKKLSWFWTVFLTGGIFTLVILAQYTIALLLFFTTTILFFVKRDLKKNDLIFLIIVALLFCVVLNDVVSDFFIWLGNSLDSDVLSHRLYALAGGRTGLQNAETNRWELYTMSLHTFINNPILGTFLQGGRNVSGHSFVLDMMARFGVLGVVILIFMYKRVYEIFYAPLKAKRGYGFLLWAFAQTILLSCLNTGMWLYVLTLYIPLLAHAVCKERV